MRHIHVHGEGDGCILLTLRDICKLSFIINVFWITAWNQVRGIIYEKFCKEMLY